MFVPENVAGIAGFEPAHDEIKTRCLTAWRYPINFRRVFSLKLYLMSTIFVVYPAFGVAMKLGFRRGNGNKLNQLLSTKTKRMSAPTTSIFLGMGKPVTLL